MVVVEVRDDDGVDRFGANADLFQQVARLMLKDTSPLLGLGMAETGIDQNGALLVSDEPNVVVYWLGLAWSSASRKLSARDLLACVPYLSAKISYVSVSAMVFPRDCR